MYISMFIILLLLVCMLEMYTHMFVYIHAGRLQQMTCYCI